MSLAAAAGDPDNSDSADKPQSSAPSIASIEPSGGPAGGGTLVRLTGSNFAVGAVVSFGGVAATSVVVSGPTTIIAKLPAHTPGAVTVVVLNPDGQSALATDFNYAAGPVVSGMRPASGSTEGGTLVTIHGAHFASGATVTFGEVAATDVTEVEGVGVTATAPPHAAGAVNVVVVNPDGQRSTLSHAFTYVAAPSLPHVTPTSGPTVGGTPITIAGNHFEPGAHVLLGGALAGDVTVVNATAMTAVAPPHRPGVVNVIVVNPDGQSCTLTAGFTYSPPSPASVDPASGSSAGGTTITITGAYFTSGVTVTVGAIAATEVKVLSSTSLTAKAPPHSPGAANVTLTSVDGQSGSLADAFTYVAPPTPFSISRNLGPTSGGALVEIAGANFERGATVTVGGVGAANVNVDSSSRITFTTPPSSPGAVDVTVINPDGQNGRLAKAFTYADSGPIIARTRSGCGCSDAGPLAGPSLPILLALGASRRRRRR